MDYKQLEGQKLLDAYVKSYYDKNIELGREMLEYVLSEKKHSKLSRSFLWNAQFYLEKLPSEKLYVFDKPLFPHVSDGKEFFGLFSVNPFIVRDSKTKCYIVGVRLLNYAGNDGIDQMRCDGKIHSFYEIHIFDPSFTTKIKSFPLDLTEINKPIVNWRWPIATGCEDFRVVNTEDENILKGICTSMEIHFEGVVRMSTFTLEIKRSSKGDNKGEIVNLEARNIIPLRGYEDNLQQKNWQFITDQPDKLVYKCTPCIVLSLICKNLWNDDSNEEIELKEEKGQVKFLRVNDNCLYDHRNGTPFIPFTFFTINKGKGESEGGSEEEKKEGYLTLSHISVDYEGKRIYYHRFLFYDKEFNLIKWSRTFYLEKSHTIEFGSSLIYDEEQKVFYIGFGFRDRFAHIHKLTEENFYKVF